MPSLTVVGLGLFLCLVCVCSSARIVYLPGVLFPPEAKIGAGKRVGNLFLQILFLSKVWDLGYGLSTLHLGTIDRRLGFV